MFNIDEIRYLCKMNHGTFYLSPKSTYEYIIYGDIDHYEILIEAPINDWIKHQNNMDYEVCDEGICVFYRDELIEIKICSLNGESIESYLSKFTYTIDGVAIKITEKIHREAFACFKEDYYAIWVDPYQLKETLKAGYIDVIHRDRINGEILFELIYMMGLKHLDIQSSLIEYARNRAYTIEKSVTKMFFYLLNQEHSAKYLELLSSFNLLEAAFPIVKQLKNHGKWHEAIDDVKKIETIFTDYDLFSDGVKRIIKRDLDMTFTNDLTKYQMLKFSILFQNAHHVMSLKINAPERYELPFVNFCDYFGFDVDICSYYGAIIQASKKMILNLKDRINRQAQFDFYEEYQDLTIDVLLLYFIQSRIDHNIINHLEYLIKGYVNEYKDLESINSEITTLDVDVKLNDVQMTLLLEKIKKMIFFGNLRYDRKHIVSYIQNHAIEACDIESLSSNE